MKNFSLTSRTALAPLVALGLSSVTPRAVHAADNDEITQLHNEIRALEQKLLVLEHRQEVQSERITTADQGFALSSPDGYNAIRLRGHVQLDSRLFFHDGGVANNGFVLRRARLISESTFAKNYGFQFVAEFGGSTATVQDANFTVALDPALQFRFGKFKSPVGLEQLQSDAWTFFNERSLATNLVPNRDLGVQASGDLLNGTFNYTVGVFNGVGDAGNSTNADFDNDKDIIGRVLVTPFRHAADSAARGLSFGIAASSGREKTSASRTAGYRTDGQQTFFSYNTATIADGRNGRVSPQFDYRRGAFGAMGEYVISTVNVRPGATGARAELQNKAWQLSAGYVLTGEESSYAGVVPRTNFDWAGGTWGAFEVVTRVADLKIDDAAFPLYAQANSNASRATSVGIGLNWYLSKAVVFKIDGYRTKFGFSPLATTASTAPILRQNEQAFITRFQLGF